MCYVFIPEYGVWSSICLTGQDFHFYQALLETNALLKYYTSDKGRHFHK